MKSILHIGVNVHEESHLTRATAFTFYACKTADFAYNQGDNSAEN